MSSAEMVRNEAMSRVNANADENWKTCVESVVRDICSTLGFGAMFTTDLVWENLAQNFPTAKTSEPRAMGPQMARMEKLGLIRKTGEFRRSTRAECHARPVQVWEVTTPSTVTSVPIATIDLQDVT